MRPSYKTLDPKGWCGNPARGAALGRVTRHNADRSFSGWLVLRRIRLNSGGYDRNGTYFGDGEPLWWYADDDGEIDAVVFARTLAKAKAWFAAEHPHARQVVWAATDVEPIYAHESVVKGGK